MKILLCPASKACLALALGKKTPAASVFSLFLSFFLFILLPTSINQTEHQSESSPVTSWTPACGKPLHASLNNAISPYSKAACVKLQKIQVSITHHPPTPQPLENNPVQPLGH
jgi:hypothetical protein